MRLIYVASPLSGDYKKNAAHAKEACRAVMGCGHAFFAPHLLYPSVLDDTVPEERQLGIPVWRMELEDKQEHGMVMLC